MACTYCYVKKDLHTMPVEIARSAAELAAKAGGHHGIIFFGGEPLLCRDVIEETVAYAEKLQEQNNGVWFHYKITTNGLLLDDAFLDYAKRHEIFIALSFDGIQKAHDCCRRTSDGQNTYDGVRDAAVQLLCQNPYTPVLMTVTPATLPFYYDSVCHLYEIGFRYIICSMDYSAPWQDRDLAMLKLQYRRLAAFYHNLTAKEEKFYLSPFEVKISSRIRRKNARAERCELGKKQISVSPDGTLYPCVQFVGDIRYKIGSVRDGVDEEARQRLYLLNEQEKPECADCAVRERCNHHCACLNKQATGDFRQVSPFLCAHERILLPIADNLANRLYRERSALWLQKQYNAMFPLLSLAEDKTLK
jgi:uncharacterized protein